MAQALDIKLLNPQPQTLNYTLNPKLNHICTLNPKLNPKP